MGSSCDVSFGGVIFPPVRVARTAIVVLNYCSLEETRSLCVSLEALSDQDFDLYVVDNFSPDTSVEALAAAAPRAHVLRTSENLGYAGGNNVVLRAIEPLDYSYVWILNPDTVVWPDTLGGLVATAEAHPEDSIFGPALVDASDRGRVLSAGLFCKTNEGILVRHQYAGRPVESLPDMPFEADFVSGCALFLRKDVLSQIGYLPEDYFLYFEEAEWLLKAGRLGYRSLVVPDVHVGHHQKSWGDGLPETYYFYYNIRAAVLFFQRMEDGSFKAVIAGLRRRFIAGWLKRIGERHPDEVAFFESLADQAILAGRAGQTGRIDLDALETTLRDALKTDQQMPGQGGAHLPEALQPLPSERTAFFVLGMHRSGTSALAGVLSKLGCDLPKTEITPGPDNEKGFFESSPLAKLHDALLASAGTSWDDWVPLSQSWHESYLADEFSDRASELLQEEFGRSRLFVLKDPRICRFVPFWLRVLKQHYCHPHVVHIHRNPLEVAASLEKRNNILPDMGVLIWLIHMLEGERGSRGTTRYFTSYERLLTNWPAVALGIQEQFDVSLPRMSPQAAHEIDTFLNEGMRQFVQTPDAVLRNPMMSEWVREVYGIFERWVSEGENPDDHATLDRIRAALALATPAFSPLLLDARDRLNTLRRDLSASQNALRVARDSQAAAEQGRAGIETELAVLQAKAAQAESALKQREHELEQLRQSQARDMVVLMQLVQSHKARMATLQGDLELATGRAEHAEFAVMSLQSSRSWRLTAPIRSLMRALGRAG